MCEMDVVNFEKFSGSVSWHTFPVAWDVLDLAKIPT